LQLYEATFAVKCNSS